MKKFRRIICLILAMLFLVSMVGCGKEEETFDPNDIGTPPDYSNASYEPFEYYAYHTLQGDRYQKDGGWVDAEVDCMSEENIGTQLDYYMATGMKTFFFQKIQYQQNYIEGGEKEIFETSELKKYMDLADEHGAEKSLICDWRLYLLSCEQVDHLYKTDDLGDDTSTWTYSALDAGRELEIVRSLKLEGGKFQFETKSEMVNFIAGCIKDYEDHPIFTYLLIRDEPTWRLINAAGDIFEAVRIYNATRTDKAPVRIQQNLLPMYGDGNMYFDVSTEDANLTKEEQFRNYLTNWLTATKADYIMFDSYPIRGSGIEAYHLKGLKIAADICKENNIDFYLVMQTTASTINGNLAHRQNEISDLYWQVNMALGFGTAKLIYYTYFTKAGGTPTSGEYSFDGGAFMTHKGERTNLYYQMTDIMSEMDWFAPVIRNFRYNASGTFKTLPLENPISYDYEENDTFEKVKSIKVSSGRVALVTELKDSARGNYLYMVQNILDPIGGKTYDTSLTIDVEFDSQYNYVAIYYKDTVRYEKLKDHKYSTLLSAGYAEFLMPY